MRGTVRFALVVAFVIALACSLPAAGTQPGIHQETDGDTETTTAASPSGGETATQRDSTATETDGGGHRPADRFSVEPVNRTVAAGGESTVTYRVTNVGSETVSEIAGAAFVDFPLALRDDEAALGTLAPGESTTAAFTVSAGDESEGPQPLVMDFQFDTPDGDTTLSNKHEVSVLVERRAGNESERTTTANATDPERASARTEQEPTDSDRPTTAGSGAGFGASLATVALLAGTLLAGRRWRC